MSPRVPGGEHTWDSADVLDLLSCNPKKRLTHSYRRLSTTVLSQSHLHTQSSTRQHHLRSAHLERDERLLHASDERHEPSGSLDIDIWSTVSKKVKWERTSVHLGSWRVVR
jgi:hypothetical protein